MRKLLVGILVLLLVTVLVVGGVMAVAMRDRDQVGGSVYTVNQVAGGLQSRPSAWVGRTITVTGVLSMDFLPCASKIYSSRVCDVMYFLTRLPQGTSMDALILHPQPDPFLSRIRSLPGIGQFFPRPQPLVGASTFRVRLEAAPTGLLCPNNPCYWGELGDVEVPKLGSQ